MAELATRLFVDDPKQVKTLCLQQGVGHLLGKDTKFRRIADINHIPADIQYPSNLSA